MKKFYVYTNTNCRRRLLDAYKIQLYFHKNNYIMVKNPEEADILIYVTCSFRNEITNDALKKIKELQKHDGELIVAGCLPAIEEEKLYKIFKGKTISTKNLHKIDEFFPNSKIKFSNLTDAEALSQQQYINYYEENHKLKFIPFLSKYYNCLRENLTFYLLNKHLLIYLFPSKPDFYHIRISWGCMGNCSYCGIKKAIGTLRSKPIKECVDDFEKGLKSKHNKFIITADDVGAFGIDIGSNFPALLDKLTSFKGDYEISVQDFDPRWVVKYIDKLETIFEKDKITSINIALQSGCSKILKLMNRFHDIKKIEESLLRLKNFSKKLSMDTHFILGFPTETDDDFLQTIDFIKKINFDMGFIYRFSCKTGTEAEKIEPKLSNYEINQRMNKAKKLLKNQDYKVITLKKHSFYTFYKKI